MANLKEVLGFDDVQWKILEIFYSNSIGNVTRCLESKVRFVHYTSADTAMRILKNREVWLRNSAIMNDSMEVRHGFNCLEAAYKKYKPEFENTFESLFPGICYRIEKHFNDWLPSYHTDTFIACVSEHENHEDVMGRLSMWRAYGGNSGVAIVMNGDVFHRPVHSDKLKAYTSPVAYLDVPRFEVEFKKLISGIEQNLDFLREIGEDLFFGAVTTAFRYALICTKHPGFKEECEWRVIYSPALEQSAVIKESIESIAGVPQRVCKLPLKDEEEFGLIGLEPAKLIDRIIIGPCQFPYEVRDAFVHLMNEEKIPDADKKVIVSDIPLRPSR